MRAIYYGNEEVIVTSFSCGSKTPGRILTTKQFDRAVKKFEREQKRRRNARKSN